MTRFLCFLVFVTIISFTSCSDNDNTSITPPTEKTLLLFMPWSSTAERPFQQNLYPYFIENIANIERSILQQGGMGNTRLLAFISLTPEYSAMIEIIYNKGKCVRDTLKRYNNYDHTAPNGIASILNDVRMFANANTYAMIIGCHGSGWIPKGVKNYYRTRSFGGTDAKYQIDVADLATGIMDAAMPMQFIAFDDCYMAGIEVAYELKDITNYLIASTSEIMADGLPYQRLWKYLAATTPNYQSIVSEFHDFYSKYSYPYGTLSVIDCSQVDNMASFMRDINVRYTFDISRISQLQKLDGMGQTIFFDMSSYIANLCDAGDINEFDYLVKRLVPYSSHTPEIYTCLSSANGGFSTVKINTFCGITISDPTTNTYVASRKSDTNWWKATHRP